MQIRVYEFDYPFTHSLSNACTDLRFLKLKVFEILINQLFQL